MVSTPEGFIDNITISPGPLVIEKNPSTSKSFRQFTEVLDVKKKTASRQLGAEK